MEVFRSLIIALPITIAMWAAVISGAWWAGIGVSAKDRCQRELSPQQRIDEAFDALK
jgi:hypothetical protein